MKTSAGSKKIALLANHVPGIYIAEFLAQHPTDSIGALYLCGHDAEVDRQIKAASKLPEDKIFAADLLKDPAHQKFFADQQFDFLICVYWPFLLKKEIFEAASNTINFHPALLPVNRGWFPHVHSILDGSPTGVTLHAIDANADTGPIWVQKEVPLRPTDTAKIIYERLQEEIVLLFKENWERIKSGSITPQPQDESRAVYHSKKEIEGLDFIDGTKTYRAKDLIALLKARTFGSRGFAYTEENGERIYLRIDLSTTSKF